MFSILIVPPLMQFLSSILFRAGSTADAFTLLERLEGKLLQFGTSFFVVTRWTLPLVSLESTWVEVHALALTHALCIGAGQVTRACVELAKEWRTDKYLRKLEVRVLYLMFVSLSVLPFVRGVHASSFLPSA
jgi:ATP-dependent protease HslVU (ClpYQ) peptidase subunit